MLLHLKIGLIVLEKLLVVLRDGRTLIGFLRSIDQFGKDVIVLIKYHYQYDKFNQIYFYCLQQ